MPLVERNDFLDAVGPIIVPKNGNERGLYSCDILGLNRIDLAQKRNEEIMSVKKLVDEILRNPTSNVKSSLMNELRDYIREQTEYIVVKRKFVEEYCEKTGLKIV